MAKPFPKKTPNRPEEDKVIFELLRLMRHHETCELAKLTWLSASTISKWRTRRVRYPRHTSVVEMLRALGYRYVIVEENPHQEAERRQRQKRNGEDRPALQ